MCIFDSTVIVRNNIFGLVIFASPKDISLQKVNSELTILSFVFDKIYCQEKIASLIKFR